MFESLTDRLAVSLRQISGKARLTEENIQGTLREVRKALLEADVALQVVKTFMDQVKQRSIGQEVSSSLSPGQAFLKIVNDELVSLMGEVADPLQLNVQPPAVILMAGLQGVGKTSSAAKLALWLKQGGLKQGEQKKVMLVSADIYRPAAIEQLKILAESAEVEFFPSSTEQNPLEIVTQALAAARKQFFDVLIVDTAGRLGIDDAMMSEIKELHQVLDPVETLFVVDAMTGQDAANTAKAFADVLPLTGVILTKVDGDSRGGAALSVRSITGRPVKFMALGEDIQALEVFHPERIASRILGMGDLLSLIEEAERKIDKKKADKLARKIQKGKKFDLEDFRDQIQQMNNMGGIANLLDKMPGMSNLNQAAQEKINSNMFVPMEAIINSMTPNERRFPDSINGSRKRRITKGSGTSVQDLNRMLKQHKQMQKMMKKVSKKGGMANMMKGMGGMSAPPGGGFPGI